MLSQEKIDQVLALLGRAGLSQREIAARSGVSRTVVGQLASGKRGPHGAGEKSERETMIFVRESTPLPEGSVFLDPPKRCGEGHLIYVSPCLTCAANAARDRAGELARAG